MKSPKCKTDLASLQYEGVEIDKCSTCQGVWLDGKELEKVQIIRDSLKQL